MNKEIELHDSTLKEIKQNKDNVTLIFDKAILHYSEGKPGVDKGTCWAQKIKIILRNATIEAKPKNLPIDIDDGYLTINGEHHENMFKISLNISSKIEFTLTTMCSEKLHIKANKIEVHAMDKAEYIQDFPGSEK